MSEPPKHWYRVFGYVFTSRGDYEGERISIQQAYTAADAVTQAEVSYRGSSKRFDTKKVEPQ